jgi:hypothetical protein
MKKFLFSLFLFFVFCFLTSPILYLPVLAAEPVKVTASVPSFWWLELTGWTSPYAQVELSMEQFLKRITTANDQGQFTFRIALPRTLAPICLISTDISNISSHPLCLPPPPQEVNILIKEVIMPPTLKIEKGKVIQGETIAAQGYTTPNSEIIPYLFEEKRRFRLPLISQKFFNFTASTVLAAEVPKPIIKSDQNGFYQFNLPTSDIGKNRIFVGSIFLDNPSPKSTTLVFNVFSWWRMILEKIIAFLVNLFWFLIKFLKKPEGIILAEIGMIIVLLFIVKSHKTSKTAKILETGKSRQ